LEDFETQGIKGVRGFSAISKYEGEIDFEAVMGYHKMRRKRKWHLMVVTGDGGLALAGAAAYGQGYF
jgi:hypothetical protein